MASILTLLVDALREARTGAPLPVPAVLDAIPADPLGIDVSSWDDVQTFLTKWDTLQEAVRDTLAVRVLQQQLPRLAEALVLIGVVRVLYVPGANPPQVQAFVIDQARVKQLLRTQGAAPDDLQWWLAKAGNPEKLKSLIVLLATAPQPLLALEYANDGFQSLPGAPFSLDLKDIIQKLTGSPAKITLPTTVHTATTPAEVLDALTAAPAASFGRVEAEIADPPASTVSIALHVTQVPDLAAASLDLGGAWRLGFTAGAPPAGLAAVYRLEWSPAGSWNAAVRSDSALVATVSRTPNAAPDILIGEADGTRLEIGQVRLAVRLSGRPGEPPFTLGLELLQAALALEMPAVLRLFGDVVALPPSLRFSSDIGLDYLPGAGLRLRSGEAGEDGSLTVAFVHPLNLQLGGGGAGLQLERVDARLVKAIDTRDFRVELRTTATAAVGPLRLTANGAGAWFGIAGREAVGGALAPTGIGITLDAGPVRGGGFLDVQNVGGRTRYAGALSLKLLMLEVFAFGILEEREGAGLSFVAVLGVRFPAGIQLGFGFMITGVGGIVGINRRVELELLRDRLASGAAGNVLFCDDPARNAPTLLGDLAAFFPEQPGAFVVGPTLQLSWLYIVRLDLALIIELPGPRAIVVAGSARVMIGFSEDLALIYLRMDFIGGVDAEAELIFFDASLVNSQVLGILDITGGMAFRLAYGPGGYVALSVGGFHPSFNPAPMRIPPLARVGTSLSLSVVAEIWMRTEMYVAFTSNTFQLGSSVEAGLSLGPLSAHGWFKFDALIQFKPFYFQADIDAGFEIEFGDISIASARVQGQLSGPGPVTIRARASIKVLFVRVSGSVTLRLGPGGGETEARLPSAYPMMLAELRPANLRGEGSDPDVVLRPERALKSAVAATGVLVLPTGSLVWEQKLAPLKTDLQRFRGQLLEQAERFSIACAELAPDALEDEEDQFAIGTFATLAPAEALNNALFQPLASGVRIAGGLAPLTEPQEPVLGIDLTVVPTYSRFEVTLNPAAFMPAMLMDMAVQRDTVPLISGGPARITVGGETWKAVGATGGTLPDAAAVAPVQAFLRARQASGFAAAVTDGALDLTGV